MSIRRSKGLLFAWTLLPLLACDGKQEAAAYAPPVQEVATLKVQGEAVVLHDEFPGRVAAFRVAEVRPQVGGLIRSRRFSEGDTVQKGQPLYSLEAAVFRANVDGAAAAHSGSEASKRQAELHAGRIQALFDQGASTQQALDDARATLAIATAEVARARAALDRARVDLDYATITAPISGYIGISQVNEGALVGPADVTPLSVIQQIDRVFVDIKSPAERAVALNSAQGGSGSEGAEVILISASGAPYPERGRVQFSDITVDPGSGERTVRVLVPNEQQQLLPGMFVRARVVLGEVPNALLVPQQSVLHDAKGQAQLFVVREDNTAEQRDVRVGRIIDGRYVVEQGLSAGERVVVEGQDRLAPGLQVTPVEWQHASTAR
ncbi:efflux RND transporter periplasmic adaptor subunit [Comamonas sp. JC664]|uniref:efflux RND transporter periplasmic adaptor subunit n=1 Tax=Comamonas sp. JC664 TaxID=2801917 RepID=UPI00191C9F61|nr:efflux RND transporter periplasmic adaptor subunit [Comamonas sp. JC664]MBL0698217.1 efflux RND transporter periplasmic adaptor subunit [Comamonas sp. JC664]